MKIYSPWPSSMRTFMLVLMFMVGFLSPRANRLLACSTNGQSAPESKSSPSQLSQPESRPVTFKAILFGNGLTGGKTPADFVKYESSDGKFLIETIITYDSNAKAIESLQKIEKSAQRTIKQLPEVDKDGHQVGQRVLVQNQMGKPEKPSYTLAWTNGSRFRNITFDSLQMALEFEKQMLQTTKQ